MQPDKTRDWLVINLKIGALSFGSAGRAMLYRDAVVNDKKWLTDDEFQEVMTITQILPGPNLVNLSAYLGYRLSGKLGTVGGLLISCPDGVDRTLSFFSASHFQERGHLAPSNGVDLYPLDDLRLLLRFSYHSLAGFY